jgi:hypothetical protein
VSQLPGIALAGVAALCLFVGIPEAALQVAATEPASYALQVTRDISTITVTFDQDILTPDPEAVRVSGVESGLRPNSVAVMGNTMTITLDPGSFHWGELVHVNLRNDIVSTDLEILTNGHYFAFTIESAPATPDFTTKMSFETSEIPYFIYGGDLDEDGTPDLAVPNEGTHDVSVLLNTSGQGIFSSRDEYSVGLKPSSIFGEDFDNDGDQDLATADIISGTVSILLNNGDGTFQEATTLVCGAQTRQIHGGDLDGDNDVDLCVTAFADDHVCIYWNDGSGQFTPGVPITDVPDGPFAIRTGDFYNNGRLDVAVACHNSDLLVILRNLGGGNLMNFGTFPIGDGPWCLNGNDVNGDGFMDLLSVASFGNEFVALINDGAGDFSTRDINATQAFPLGVFAADVDGDGDIDGTSSNYSGGSVGIYLNDGLGDFSLHTNLQVHDSGSYPWAHDLDGDGDLDLSAVDEIADSLFVFYNDGTASSVEDLPLASGIPTLRAWPNPFRGGQGTTIRLANVAGPVRLTVLTVDGRRIRSLGRRSLDGGVWELVWDGRDASGRPVASGWYLVRAVSEDGSIPLGVQVLR